MADGRHIAEYWKRYNSPINGPISMKLGWSHPFFITSMVASHHVPDMSAMLRLPWQQPLPSNGALYIRQLWASGLWRPNARTNRVEIWYTAANYDHNDDHMIKS